MNVSRNMFFAAVAVAVVCGGRVRAKETAAQTLARKGQDPQGVAFIVTAAGVIVDKNTQYHQVGTTMRDAGIYGSVYTLASEHPTNTGTVAAMCTGTATAMIYDYASSTQPGQAVAAQMPAPVRNNSNWLKYCVSVVAGYFAGSAVANKIGQIKSSSTSSMN